MAKGKRDTSRDGFGNRLQTFVLTNFRGFWSIVQRIDPLKRKINKSLVNGAIDTIPPRPFPLSTMCPYTSWDSLTDRTWSGRHLPPDPEFNRPGNLPPLDLSGIPTEKDSLNPTKGKEKLEDFFRRNPLAELFRKRNDETVYSEKSTLLFPYWVQWFTDGFLRTDYSELSSRLKNKSNHHIDLCNVYGLNREATELLRAMSDGKLKSQMLKNEEGVEEEYPEFLYDENSSYAKFKKEFVGIYEPVERIEALPAKLKKKFFAMGVERANVQLGYVMFNVLCLREHNRLCDLLKEEYYSEWKMEAERVVAGFHFEAATKPDPDLRKRWINAQPAWRKDPERYIDERIFQTARSIVMLIIMKIVVEEYINHITPYHFDFKVDPGAFAKEKWYRQNWMSVEFNLVYRWHSALPDELKYKGEKKRMMETLFNNDMVIKRGLGALFEEASYQPATRIGMFNTADFLVPVELLSIALGRQAQLKSYNDYRESCGFPRVTDFDQITSDEEIQRKLKELYGHVDNIEFYVGIYAEEVRENSALPALVGRLVGIDAFSQAFTNPLLANNIFNEKTFTPLGLKIIQETNTVSDLVHRNIPQKEKHYNVTFYRYRESRKPVIRRFFEAIVEKPLIKLLVFTQLRLMKGKPTERGQHPKHQGCVWATVAVEENLPQELRVGVFKELEVYDAVIRFSNGEKHDDTEDDVHGMAIKLLGVDGEKLLDDEKHEATHDFVLADNPVFLARNVWHLSQFVRTKKAIERGVKQEKDLVRTHPASKNFKKPAKPSPLVSEYWSQTPYRFGEHIVKYYVKPSRDNDFGKGNQNSRDFLREAMVKHLTSDGKAASFDFCIQIAPDEDPKWIDDPTIAWNEQTSPPVKIATITIDPQEFDTQKQREFCEALSYTPWRCLPEHEPLGQINRARGEVYQASSKLRHQKTGMPRKEPTIADRP